MRRLLVWAFRTSFVDHPNLRGPWYMDWLHVVAFSIVLSVVTLSISAVYLIGLLGVYLAN